MGSHILSPTEILMAKKSLTQMTKTELIEFIREKNIIIADLNAKNDQLELAAVASEARPVSSDTSKFLESLLARIRKLEEQLDNDS